MIEFRTSATGTGWKRTPWHAVQRAAWEARWLDGESFEIPDLETSDVHPKRPPARVQRDSFHQHLVLGEDRVAGVARFVVAWSTPGRSDAVMRQATVLEFAPDKEVESFLVHGGLAGSIGVETRQIHRGLGAGTPTLKAMVTARGA
jgi:hypothetical protein